MDRPEDELPPLFIEAAQAVVMMPPFATEEQTGKAIEAVRLALLKAREEAFEEVLNRLAKESKRYDRNDPHDTAYAVASAIRQHSQKGER